MSGLNLWHKLKDRVETQIDKCGSLLRKKQHIKKVIWAIEHKID